MRMVMSMFSDFYEKSNSYSELYNACLQGHWNVVCDMYREKSWTRTANFARSNYGHTALHLAVLQGKDADVQRLMSTIPEEDYPRIVNMNGNTPLHLAASRGLLKKCQYIVEALDKHSESETAKLAGSPPESSSQTSKCFWLSARNKDEETPLFLAALHGQEDVFLYLHSKNRDVSLCTRTSDGNTILHVTIDREYFGLAYSITHIYDRLATKNNSDGVSPLQFLANKPSAFRSSTHLQWWKSIIYHTLPTDPMMFVPKKKFEDPEAHKTNTPNLPENYTTWRDFFVMVENILKKIGEVKSGNKPKAGVGAGNADLEGQEYPLRSKFPRNYATLTDFLSGSFMYILGQTGFGVEIRRIKNVKERHSWSFLLMEKLLAANITSSEIGSGGGEPYFLFDDEDKTASGEINPLTFSFNEETDQEANQSSSSKPTSEYSSVLIAVKNGMAELVGKILEGEKKKEEKSSTGKTPCETLLITVKDGIAELIDKIIQGKKKEKQKWSPSQTTWDTPILLAAKNGVSEMMKKILELTPVAVHDTTVADKKNVLLVAVENRHPQIFQTILEKEDLFQGLIQRVDYNGNTALHYAAMSSGRQPWRIPGAALQMQWETKWYEYVKKNVPDHFVFRANNLGKSPAVIFNEEHKDLVTDGGKWLKSTANSCSVVAALIATVAFATAVQIPGGSTGEGKPNLEGQTAFNLFAISSLLSLCFSVTALIMFLAILTSRYQTRDFRSELPLKLFLGLSSLLVSIASVLVSFCGAHFFEVKDRFGHSVFPLYFVTCLPISFYALAQFPLYIDLWKAINIDIPQPSRALQDF